MRPEGPTLLFHTFLLQQFSNASAIRWFWDPPNLNGGNPKQGPTMAKMCEQLGFTALSHSLQRLDWQYVNCVCSQVTCLLQQSCAKSTQTEPHNMRSLILLHGESPDRASFSKSSQHLFASGEHPPCDFQHLCKQSFTQLAQPRHEPSCRAISSGSTNCDQGMPSFRRASLRHVGSAFTIIRAKALASISNILQILSDT